MESNKIVCFRCRKDWKAPGSPGFCPECKEYSVALVAAPEGQKEEEVTQDASIHCGD